jgi:hypothetical protein
MDSSLRPRMMQFRARWSSGDVGPSDHGHRDGHWLKSLHGWSLFGGKTHGKTPCDGRKTHGKTPIWCIYHIIHAGMEESYMLNPRYAYRGWIYKVITSQLEATSCFRPLCSFNRHFRETECKKSWWTSGCLGLYSIYIIIYVYIYMYIYIYTLFSNKPSY